MKFEIEYIVIICVVCVMLFVGGMVLGRDKAIDGCLQYYQDMAYKDSRELCPQIISGNKK